MYVGELHAVGNGPILLCSQLVQYAGRTTTCGVQLCFTTTLPIYRHRAISKDLRQDLAFLSQFVPSDLLLKQQPNIHVWLT